ncbi:hypothetical protein GYMLUDRAFT_265081, partial [Collybiopsis luxurians FD-317 M1]
MNGIVLKNLAASSLTLCAQGLLFRPLDTTIPPLPHPHGLRPSRLAFSCSQFERCRMQDVDCRSSMLATSALALSDEMRFPKEKTAIWHISMVHNSPYSCSSSSVIVSDLFDQPKGMRREGAIDVEDVKAKKEAEDSKKAGSEAYKNREFDEAAKCFQKAWEVYPMIFNHSEASPSVLSFSSAFSHEFLAVFFERKLQLDDTLCQSLRLSGLLIPKQGRSSVRYQKSPTEHRTPDVLNKPREAEKIKVEAHRMASIDSEKSVATRGEGYIFKA